MEGRGSGGILIGSLLLLVGICLQNTVADKDIKVHVGSTVALPCRVDTNFCGELHSVKFYRETNRIYVYSKVGGISRPEGEAIKRMKLEYTPANSEVLLMISDVEIHDEASYKCEITYLDVRENCAVVQIIKLTTLVKPKEVTIWRNKQELLDQSTLGPHPEGTQVELICETSEGKPVPKVTWYNGTHEMKAATPSKTKGDRTGLGIGTSKLQVVLSRGDLGAKYECRVESDALDEPIVRWLSVDVHVKPTSISLTGVKDHVVQGSHVLLTCEVTGARPAAEVKWYNGSDLITKEEQFIRNEVLEASTGDLTFKTLSTLSFIASRWEDGTSFDCNAENSVMLQQNEPPLKDVLIFKVYYPPVVTVWADITTTNETGDILLHCNYISNPMQLEGVVWAKDDKNLTLSADKYEGGDIENPPLRIKNVSREDMGNYTCICRNSVGSTKSDDVIFLDVHYPPTVEIQMDPPTPVKANDKGNVTLACKTADGNPTILQKVRWFLGNELLKELPECNYTSYDENGFGEGSGGPLCGIEPSILSLEYVEESFAGNYTCQGETAAGWGPESLPQELIVYYPPSPAKLRYSPQTVIKKGSVTLDCSVDHPGRPENISYIWYRGGAHHREVTTSNWTIVSVTLVTKSNFTCIATNEGGNSTAATVSIDVLAPPAFIQNLPPYQGILMSSKNISLTCRVECHPLCSIKWFKDGHLLDTGNSHLYDLKEVRHDADLQKNDFESIESTLIWNMTAWPGEQLDRTAPNSFYTCQSSSNIIGSGVNSTTELAVDYPPENLTVSKLVVSVVEDQNTEKIGCSGKGHPKLSFTWKKEGSTENVSKTYDLSLNQVTRAQSGKYICEATNRHGSAITHAYINVQYKPTCRLDKVEYEGGPALECVAHANPQEVTFTYKIKGENDTIDSSEVVQNKLRSYLKLDSGVDTQRTYQCYVNNSVGSSSPCEYDVAAAIPWWTVLTNDTNLYILIAVIIAIIICVIIICIIIILVCRKKRANNKSPNPSSMGDKGGLGGPQPDGGLADPLNDPDRGFYENLPFHGMQNPPNKPYRSEFSDLDYADVDYRSYGPINYKAASIYAAMKRNQNNNKLQEKEYDDLL